jgi:hypothetical protein
MGFDTAWLQTLLHKYTRNGLVFYCPEQLQFE